MTNASIDPNDPFANIDESEFEAELKRNIAPSTNVHTTDIGNVTIPGFVEDCPKCRGTGNWRTGYKCFKCHGTGKLEFKTSPEARGKARVSSRKRTAKNEAAKAAASELKWLQWLEADEVARDWLLPAKDAGNSFAVSLFNGGMKYGRLTEGQQKAIYKIVADDQLKAENLAKRPVTPAAEKAESIDISGLKGYYAVPDGDTRLKICVRKPGKNSNWHGHSFVDDGGQYGNRQNYGRQAPEGTYQGKIVDQLKAILADPYAAQVAYGKLTGSCGTCGRILEDEASIEAGIGPICAAKF